MAETDLFSKAKHTFVVSDIHVTTAEPVHPKDPLWRRFKQKDFFVDEMFKIFLEKIHEIGAGEPVELILAGDIFDFDGVTQLPQKQRFTMSWLEIHRGLNTEERKSRFKIRRIMQDHSVLIDALAEFVHRGNRIIFIIGNHDLELHWPGVRMELLRAMKLDESDRRRIRFTNWFYLSNQDTLIEHGNQHDSHSNCQNPINPKIRGLRKERIRLPFGCLANRYMLNGMGYFNPHSDRSYLMTAKQYVKFIFKHVLRKEPLLIWTWFWGALVTLFMTMKEGMAPAVKDPLRVEDQVEEIAKSANATPRVVRALREIHARPMFWNPLSVARELWLDRAFIVVGVFFGALWILSLLNIVLNISYWWTFPVAFIVMPFFLFYFRSFKSKIIVDVKYYERAVKLSSRITGVKRVIYGHTHEFVHTNFDGIEYLNSGTWSPAFDDVACTKPSCPKTFVWIKTPAPPENTGSIIVDPQPQSPPAAEQPSTERIANVYEWKGHEMALLC